MTSDSQAERVKIYRAVERPIALLQGPPGTGKTYIACRIALKFLEATPRQKVLMVSPMNNSVDASVLFLQEMLNGRPRSDDRAPVGVIRLHAMITEIEVSLEVCESHPRCPGVCSSTYY